MTPKKLVIEVMDDAMADLLRQKSAFEKLRIAGRMWQSARVFLRGAIRTEYPDWNADQVNREIAKRISHGVVKSESPLGTTLVQPSGDSFVYKPKDYKPASLSRESPNSDSFNPMRSMMER